MLAAYLLCLWASNGPGVNSGWVAHGSSLFDRWGARSTRCWGTRGDTPGSPRAVGGLTLVPILFRGELSVESPVACVEAGRWLRAPGKAQRASYSLGKDSRAREDFGGGPGAKRRRPYGGRSVQDFT